MNKEFEFLNTINKVIPNGYLGDDCAYLKDENIAISTDSLIEDVHFKLDYMTPFEIGQKALLVNVSDILASGAVPKYFLVALGGNINSSFIEDFYNGIKSVASDYNVKLVGGDLTKSDKIMITITIIGDYRNRKISSRKNAKNGYIIAVAGEFGTSAQGLYELQKGIKKSYFINLHKKPILHPEISSAIALNSDFPYAMMDSSDGLFDCLYQIADKSKVRIDIDYSKIPHKTENKDFILFGGEDYSLVAALHKTDFEKIKGLTKIGTVTQGSSVYIDGKELEYKSFEHFK